MTAPPADPDAVGLGPAPRWVAVGHSSRADATAAVEEALAAVLVRGQPKLVLLFASPAHPLQELAERVRQRIGTGQLIGCSTAGELAPGHSGMGGLVLWALGGAGFSVASGYGDAARLGLRQAAREAAGCLEHLERRRHTVLVLLADGLGGDQMEVVRGAYDVAGVDVPLVGGCAGDDMAMRRTHQIHAGQMFSRAVVAAAISSDAPLGIGVAHCWEPIGAPMLVTGSQSNRITSLDDRPALDLYLDAFATPPEVRQGGDAFARFATTRPLGLRRRDRIEIRFVSGADLAQRSLLTIAEMPQGGLAYLMQGDARSVLAATEEACRTACNGLGGADPQGLLLFDCVGRRAVLQETQGEPRAGAAASADLPPDPELARIGALLGDCPYGGFHTYGEIARSRGAGGFHNQTLVALALA
ncbi:MAG: FIST N-terminal domain-containing protein [Synechococcaceae cyanobacterium]|nr:FIST N-terminal domain-containing protein [Synechococcaceae cyanobacterium]